MSNHCCGTQGEKIIVNCCCGTQPTTGSERPIDEKPPVDENDEKPPVDEKPVCTLIRVDFVSLRVTEDGETGAGDWTLHLEANGILGAKAYPDDYIDDDDGIPYDIGVSINVPIDQFTTELRIKVSGYERDSFLNGGNDLLPIAQRVWSSAQNFGLGQTFDVSASNDELAYSATVRISCAQQSSLVESRTQLVQAAVRLLERKNQKRVKSKKPMIDITDARALNQSIRSLERKGWILKTVSGDDFIFEGFGRVPSLKMEDQRKQKGK